MRVKADFNKFKFLFKLGFNMKKDPSDYFLLKFTPQGVILSDVWRDVLATFGLFNPSFFDEYQVGQEEVVPITVNFQKMSGYLRGLSGTMRTENGKLVMESGNEKYTETLTSAEWRDFPLELDFGEYIKLRKMDPSVIAKITADELKSLPSLPYIRFESTDSDLTVKVIPSLDSQLGIFESKPKAQFLKVSPVSTLLNNEYFETMIDPLTGPVHLLLDQIGIAISQVTKDYALCLVLAGIKL